MNKEGHIGVVSNTHVPINKNSSMDAPEKGTESATNSNGQSMQTKVLN